LCGHTIHFYHSHPQVTAPPTKKELVQVLEHFYDLIIEWDGVEDRTSDALQFLLNKYQCSEFGYVGTSHRSFMPLTLSKPPESNRSRSCTGFCTTHDPSVTLNEKE
jgi:hypothetical protein